MILNTILCQSKIWGEFL